MQTGSQLSLLPVGFGEVLSSTTSEYCIKSLEKDSLLQSLNLPFKHGNGRNEFSFPMLEWPFENPLHQGISIVNYIDHSSTPSVVDYMCLPHAYDTHTGTDMGIYHFRAMDEGRAVLVAAGGQVVHVEYANPDRNVGPGGGPANVVIILHSDSTIGQYWHLRKNSVTVNVGETVVANQMLGYAGSSGLSYSAHLHFEVGSYDQFGVYVHRDPWEGPCNTLLNLWIEPEPYVGDDPLRIFDMGVYTEATSGGNPNNIPQKILEERLTQPRTMGLDEPIIGVWALLQGQAGNNFTVKLIRPNSSIFGAISLTLSSKVRRGWRYWYWNFNISPLDYGIWRAEIEFGGEVLKSVSFTVGENTYYAPRFWPLAGRSLHINGSIQRDTLRVSSLCEPVTYSLLNAPNFITLENDSVVVIGGASDQPYRSYWLDAIAIDGLGLTDTMRYHLVDPQKLQNPPMAINDEVTNRHLPESFNLLQNYPNPFNPTTTIEFSLPKASFTTLKIYNILGEEIVTLVSENLSAGIHKYHWNANALASGVYFYKIETDRQSLMKKALLIK